MDKIEISLIANAGIYIKYKNTRLMFDGLFDSKVTPFDTIPEKTMAELLREHGDYSNSDLLFTHLHPDHFSFSLVCRYLDRNPESRVIFPQSRTDVVSAYMTSQKVRYFPIDPSVADSWSFRLGASCCVRAVKSLHMGPQYANTPHLTYLLSVGGHHFIIAGDADCNAETFASFAGINIDAAFVNPIFYYQGEGRNLIRRLLHPKTVVVYHLPFQKDKQEMYARMAISGFEHEENIDYKMILFNTKDQTLFF